MTAGDQRRSAAVAQTRSSKESTFRNSSNAPMLCPIHKPGMFCMIAFIPCWKCTAKVSHACCS